MSDQDPAIEQETADTPNNPEGTGTPTQQEIDWAKRYSDLQPEYTRATQEAAQYRQATADLQSDDADTRIAAAQHLGLDPALFVEFEEEDPSGDTPYLTRDEFKAFQAEQAQKAQAQAEQQRVAQIGQRAIKDLERIGVPEHLRDTIYNNAVATFGDGDDAVDIEGAYKRYVDEVRSAEMKEWQKTKRTGFVSPGGQQATHTPNLDNPDERQAWMLQRYQDRIAGS
jgi:hypothetical protein